MFERLKQNHFWWFQGPMIMWAVALFVQSSIPGDRIPSFEFFTNDKLIHFLEYVILAICVHRGIRFQNRFPFLANNHYLFTFIFVAAYGASDEFHQYFVRNRNSSILDLLADCFGSLVYLAYYWLRGKLKPSEAST